MSRHEDESRRPETPAEDLPQDPGIPGFDTVAHDHTPIPDEKDAPAERRERVDDPDEEGHQTAGEIDADV
ncbi:MAG: hypothetical protein KY396_06335 [Actinobacteria bacterium]|nr:hypothetical protein [Actinomycetota bacterium]